MSDAPCNCCKKLDTGYWYQDCSCGNSGDIAMAQDFCTEQNVHKTIRAEYAAQLASALELIAKLQASLAALSTQPDTRRLALEEAAKVCEHNDCFGCAAAIRALAAQHSQKENHNE